MRTAAPSRFTAGESLSWKKSFSDYLAGDGWTLTYYFRGPGKGFDAEASADANAFIVTVPASDTAVCVPGDYAYQGVVTKDSESIVVDRGSVTVLPGLASTPVTESFDGRSQAQRILDAIDATLEGKATADQLEYTIGNRQLKRYSMAELLQVRDRYASIVAREKTDEGVRNGRPFFRNVYTRFEPPR